MGPFQKSLLEKLIKRLLLQGIMFEDFFQHKFNPGWEECIMLSLNCILKDSDFEALLIKKDQKCGVRSQNLKESGNHAVKRNDFATALSFYTRSIALAPQDSVALSLAFANRGVALKGMGLFKESICDTERALALHYPKNMHYKLFTRLGQCYQQLGNSDAALKNFSQALNLIVNSAQQEVDKEKLKKSIQDGSWQTIEGSLANLKMEEDDTWFTALAGIPKISPALPPHLSYGPNPPFPGMSKNIVVSYNKTRNQRCLVAANDIKPGDILIVEDSCSALVDVKCQWTHCSHCLQQCHNLLPCSKCAWCMFCSEECMAAAQKAGHEIECSLMPIVSENFDSSCCLVTRLISHMGIESLCKTAVKEETNRPVSPEDWINLGLNEDGKYSGIDGLLSLKYRNLYNDVVIFTKCAFAVSMTKMLNLNSSISKIKIQALLLKILCALKSSGQPLTEHQIKLKETKYVQIGHTLVVNTPLFGHSCDPNVVQHHHKTTTVVRALQVIPKGSELFISYGRTFHKFPKSLRQKDLADSLNGLCNCEACRNDWPVYNNLSKGPNCDFPREELICNRMVASIRDIQKKAMKNNHHIVSKETLPLFLKHLILLDTFDKKLNKSYYSILELVREYFAKQGNISIVK